MARRLIGLDVGTNAVTVAEVSPGTPPVLRAFGQVALPLDAMREGEVVDDAAVGDAVARLRDAVGLKKAGVRVGLASPRVIVRQVEMPVMSRDELDAALRFQAHELIPIPIEDAVLDFAVLGTEQLEGAEPVMRVLLAAAQQSSVRKLVDAVERGGFAVDAVDLVPLALVRALAQPFEGVGAEGIVSFGAGVTAITVHESGAPRFVRVLGTGGRALTDAIARELDLTVETAEALKRELGRTGDDLVTRGRAAVERPLATQLDEVRSSLDYYRNQPGAARLTRVVVTGGGSQLPGLVERLAALVGVPVEPARPRELMTVGDIGFDESELPQHDPYLPAAVGLALGGAGLGTIVDLRPAGGRRRAATTSSRALAGALAGLGLLAVVLAVPTVMRMAEKSDAEDELAQVEDENESLQRQIAALADAKAKQTQLDTAKVQVDRLLETDVSWARMLSDISKTIPNDAWLTSFQGQNSAATGGRTIAGPVGFEAVGLDYPSVSSWIERISTMPSLTGLWVPNASAAENDVGEVVNYSSSAQLTPAAKSDRQETYAKGGEE